MSAEVLVRFPGETEFWSSGLRAATDVKGIIKRAREMEAEGAEVRIRLHEMDGAVYTLDEFLEFR
jgi:uncharacterized protein YfcZ (UPF0381/DUF406 family)